MDPMDIKMIDPAKGRWPTSFHCPEAGIIQLFNQRDLRKTASGRRDFFKRRPLPSRAPAL